MHIAMPYNPTFKNQPSTNRIVPVSAGSGLSGPWKKSRQPACATDFFGALRSKERERCVLFAQLIRSILHNRIPGQLVVQITNRCNARCPQCGMRITNSFPRANLDADTVKKTIDAAACRGIQAISFTGGEPLLNIRELAGLMRYAGAAGIPFIRTGTNGFSFTRTQQDDFDDRVINIAEQLADTPLRNFWISLDSIDDALHEKMRGFPGVVAGIARALPIFHQVGIFPAVNLGINRNLGGALTRDLQRADFASEETYLDAFFRRYRQAFGRFYQRAIDLGFTIANACYPMSIDVDAHNEGLDAVYAATATDDLVRFSASEKKMLFAALYAAIEKYRSKIRIFTPLCSLRALQRQYDDNGMRRRPYGCRGGVDFFFVDAADGHVYPCGYRGKEDMGYLWQTDIHRITPGSEADACRRCDWECFRDPSEMFGPLLEATANPVNLLRRIAHEPHMPAIWTADLRYYRACDFFDGRRAPDRRRLASFARCAANGLQQCHLPAAPFRFNQTLSDF